MKIRTSIFYWRKEQISELSHSGKNGVVTFEAKTDELARHYISDFGAVRIFSKQSGGPIMLMIADNAALTIFNTYLS